MKRYTRISTDEVKESVQELQALKRKQKDPLMVARVEALLLVKSGKCLNYTDIGDVVGNSRRAVARWFNSYKNNGLMGLLKREPAGKGRKSQIDLKLGNEGLAEFKAWFADPIHCPASYKEVQTKLQEKYDIQLDYSTIWFYFSSKFDIKLKTTRKSNVKKNIEAGEAFIKKSTGSI